MRSFSKICALGLLTLAVPAAAKARCPANFKSFWADFVRNVGNQRNQTANPVIIVNVIDAQPDPKTVSKRVSPDALPLPIASIPIGHEVSFKAVSAARATVMVSKPDTDWVIFYTFEKSNCWRLVERNDQSL